jgi:hypothetical protein
MATLEQFLRTGELGPLRTGMSQAEVTALLGPPEDTSVARNPQILKYGGLQLWFLTRQGTGERWLAHIGLYFWPRAEPLPEPTRPSDFAGTPETTSAEVREFLSRAGLTAHATVEGEDANYLILPSGARITFEGPLLRCINLVSPTKTPAKKQISVSLPADVWNRLREVARQSGRSVPELCAGWITERVNGLQNGNGIVSPAGQEAATSVPADK